MTETKTVELPLTKSEQRHLDNINRRDAKRKATKDKVEAKAERDAKIRAVNDEYAPKILKLQDERRAKLEKIWADWREERSTS